MDNLPLYEKLTINVFPIKIKKFSNSKNIHFHWHEEIEILFFTNGSATILCNEISFKVEKTDIIFVNAKETHRGINFSDDAAYYCIQINTEFFNTLFDDRFVLIDNKICDKYCINLIKNIIKENDVKKFGYQIAIKRDIFDLFAYLLRNYQKETLEITKFHTYFKNIEKLNEVLTFINAHYDENLSVDILSKKFFMSQSYFSHFFKNQISKSVMQYVNDVRISRAKLILENEKTSISSIADIVGFEDINYFSRKFKQKTGLTPTKYRELNSIQKSS